ncbi:hypothetical protein O9K51_05573 [Purpureocillium lavendulum]|uniref:ABM domain-containing protein n=1 Tax=Purpureocillium lavendulum TaxID=1247861 RepID=A0AB34FUH5_9HYPO|nr:hypothetical protein O9K51_05573 [Purpureocillium lavendulum]
MPCGADGNDVVVVEKWRSAGTYEYFVQTDAPSAVAALASLPRVTVVQVCDSRGLLRTGL